MTGESDVRADIEGLTAFLRARLDEEQALAEAGDQHSPDLTLKLDDDMRWISVTPARVLADVEAKRRMLALHQPGEYGECVTCDVGAMSCGCCGYGDWPCATVRLLALPYTGRPGYREEWRP